MSEWNGDLSQLEYMHKDECIVVDENDKVLGHKSKYETHVFSKETPRGILHRAFSVFLFNSEGKLLLQQRALEKITFPGVWTNTCCSHPLFTSSEIDDPALGKDGIGSGAKAAAVRKLKHELGIESEDVTEGKFKFLTRLHYWAADIATHGTDSPWGEHEMDFILFMQADVDCVPHPDEVKAIKYVTLPELKAMMDPSSGLRWSPWFRIIAEHFLPHWWSDLNVTLTTDKFVDKETIYRFDPADEYMGGAGKAGPWLGKLSSPFKNDKSVKDVGSQSLKTKGNKTIKQGAYGKVKIHKHSLLSQIVRLDEIFAGLYVLYGSPLSSKMNLIDEDVKFCDDMLGKVSRSFAAVIRSLPKGLCLDILVFYLVLRALDTVEDDMEAFKGKEFIKIEHLQTFYKVALKDKRFKMDGVGEGDERTLLEQFHRVSKVYQALPETSQAVIADICRRMGYGMAEFVSKDLGQGTVELKDYYQYCHYVAGLIGEGLSNLFTSSGYELQSVANVGKTLGNTMGLFLQKTNIIRDYLEDYVDGRAFWPQAIWKIYSTSGQLGEFAKPEAKKQALACLNHMVTDGLECVPECLTYLSLLKNPDVFLFCAIPQVMAIATLAEVYNNHNVFTGVVKIRKGLACKLILESKDLPGVHRWFNIFARDILTRIPRDDPNASNTHAICTKIIMLTDAKALLSLREKILFFVNMLMPILIAFALRKVLSSSTVKWDHLSDSPISPTKEDLFWFLVIFVGVSYIILHAFLRKLTYAQWMKDSSILS